MGSPIEAPAAGIVTDAGWESGYGNTVTYGFGSVTTTIRTERQDLRTRVFGPPEFGPSPSASTSPPTMRASAPTSCALARR